MRLVSVARAFAGNSGLRKIIESDRPFSSNPDSHFHRKRTAVFMRVDSLEAGQSAHAGVVSDV
jgi:hypothetical protein